MFGFFRDKRTPVEKALGVRFRDANLLREALTHPSYRHFEAPEACDNQRLEFLGDAVLHLLLADRIYRGNPRADEGAMTETRRDIECGGALAAKARELGFDKAVLLGKPEHAAGMASADKTMEDVFEAFMGALWLDRGLKQCAKVVDRLFKDELDEPVPRGARRDALKDPKSALQWLSQKTYKTQPEYIPDGEEGEAHNRVFHFGVRIAGCDTEGRGGGKTKKEAQAAAAADLLGKLG